MLVDLTDRYSLLEFIPRLKVEAFMMQARFVGTFRFLFPALILFAAINGGYGQTTRQPPVAQEVHVLQPGQEPVHSAKHFNVLPGFEIDLLYRVDRKTQGSWVSCTFDHKGRLICSDQGKAGLYRLTPPASETDQQTQVEKLTFAMPGQKATIELSGAQGLLYAFDSLYVVTNGGPGSGLYRAKDINGDDQFDQVEKLKSFSGGGEHGPHAIRLSPDGKSLFVIAGNHTSLPTGYTSAIPKNWSEDLLLPRQWDARGHARGKLAPGGWICKTDPDGKAWEVFSIGYRNAYDFDFNADGEIFAYDSDMEWDMGMPWYRPTRVVHATSGSEFGWRSGTGKWPEYYPDSLPSLENIGPGSPVGVEFGYGAKFPAKFQKSLFIADWTFGTIYAIHTKPEGSSYTATKEEFVSRTPLPLTDLAVGPDGHLYFMTGGRGVESFVYRVRYTGDESTATVDPRDETHQLERKQRRQLETLHQPNSAGGTIPDAVWKALGSDDRFARYAARVALEFQPTDIWGDEALKLKDATACINAMVGLARQGASSAQPSLLNALDELPLDQLNTIQKRELLRAYSLAFIRMGEPSRKTKIGVANRFDPLFPAEDEGLNRELARLLVYVESPRVIDKALKLMAEGSKTRTPAELEQLIKRNARYGGPIARMLANQPELQNLHYAFVLRNLRYGWTLEQRREYLQWLKEAAKRSGGNSYGGFIRNMRDEALAKVPAAMKKLLGSEAAPVTIEQAELPKPVGPGKDWTAAEVIQMADSDLHGRNFENGKRAFAAAKCIVCHRFDGEGGATGPDLSNVAGRFSTKDLAEALVEPSKVISDRFRASIVATFDGKVITGQVVAESDEEITVMTDAFDGSRMAVIKRDDIDEIQPSKVSLMPGDLLKPLNRDEVLDLIAYMLSRGNPDDIAFAKEMN